MSAIVQVVSRTIDARTGEPFRWRHRISSVSRALSAADEIRAEHPEWTVSVLDEAKNDRITDSKTPRPESGAQNVAFGGDGREGEGATRPTAEGPARGGLQSKAVGDGQVRDSSASAPNRRIRRVVSQ